MHPYLFEIFGRQAASYGFFMVLGAFAAWLLVRLLAGKNYNDDVWMTMLICICGGFAGAFLFRPITKIPELFIHWDLTREMSMGQIMGFLFGEIVFYGGLIGGVASLLIFCKIYKIPVLPLADLFAPGIALAHAFGRVGCFLGGCCYGIQVHENHPLAVRFPEINAGGAPPGVPLLATQLVEAACLLILAAVLSVVYKRTAGKGFALCLYGMLYSILRFTLEFYRGDLIRGVYGLFSTSQYISLAIFAVCAVFLTRMVVLRRSNSQINM